MKIICERRYPGYWVSRAMWDEMRKAEEDYQKYISSGYLFFDSKGNERELRKGMTAHPHQVNNNLTEEL